MEWGLAIGLFAAAIAAILPGMGSAKAVGLAGETAAGVSAETPEASSKLTLLQLLPATQGIYGFVLGIIGMGNLDPAMTVSEGWQLFAAAMPLAIVGLFSAIFQGKTAVGGLNAIAKKDISVGRLILFPAMVETYAILALVISIMMM